MVVDSFKSAETTAKWEIELSDIGNCKKKEDFFEKLRKTNITIKQCKQEIFRKFLELILYT